MKILHDLAPALRRNLLVLFTAGLLFWSSLGSLLPTLPLYVEHVGGTRQQIGLVMGAFAIGLLLSRARLGRLADQRSRKLVLLIGTTVAAIAPLGYLWLPSIPLLILTRIFHGVSIAAFGTAYNTLVADLAPPQNRGELIGYMSLVNPIGVAVGPAIGGLLQAWAGYPPLFVLATALGAMALLCTSQVREPDAHRDALTDNQRINPETQFWRLLNSPRVRIPTLVMLMVGLAFGTLSTFIPLFIAEAQVGLNAGLFYTAAAIASFSIRILTGRASDRYGRGLFITCSLASYTLAMAILWQAHTATAFLLAGLLEGAGFGILIPLFVALIADRSQPQERGQVFSLCLGGFDLGMAIAGPILGSIAEQVGYRMMFGLATGIAFVAVVIFTTQSSKDLSHSLRFALGRGRDVYALKPSS